MPRRGFCFLDLFDFDRARPVIVSMAAQIAEIAMTDFMKRMCDFPPPMAYMLRSCNSD
jgi:hypothetical protein